MKEQIRRVEFFASYDYTGIEKHLEKMAENGWILCKITPLFWEYRRAEPQKLRFSVTYFPKASEFDPEPQEEQLIYQDYSARTGWTFVCRFAQMQIFCSGEVSPVPMETDPVLKAETVHRAAKKGFLPYNFGLLLLSVFSWRSGGIGSILWVLLFLLSFIELFRYYQWRTAARKAAIKGLFLDTPRTARYQTVLSVLLLVGALIFARGNRARLVGCTLFLIGLLLMMAAINAVKQLLKRLGAPRHVNLAVTVSLSAVLAAALTAGVLWVCWNFVIARVIPFR